MDVIHYSAECYPAAKAGGLGDVVGALPKYQQQHGANARVVMPAYQTPWLESKSYNVVHAGVSQLGKEGFSFEIRNITNADLGFDLYTVHIPGRFDRPGIYIDPDSGYGYWDELERFTAFQVAALEWTQALENQPDLLHCHDHHAGLIPFMITRCFKFKQMESIPTVLTIHNGEYHGEHAMDKYELLPPFDWSQIGLLEWGGKMNSLAAGIKCAWRVTTVSEHYMEELAEDASGLESLIRDEWPKTEGIINGIDTEVWDPSSDPLIDHHYTVKESRKGKAANKEQLCEQFDLDPELPLVSFIGRLVEEKGADLLPDLFEHFLKSGTKVNFVILGTGLPHLHDRFQAMSKSYLGYFDARLEYNEKLAHQIYAGTDFIIMPSRVEPCGLNQMYAMRYGSIPIVRSTGGLHDTVKDLSETGGYGILFDKFSLETAIEAVERAITLYKNKQQRGRLRHKVMRLDFSWSRSAEQYMEMYQELTT